MEVGSIGMSVDMAVYFDQSENCQEPDKISLKKAVLQFKNHPLFGKKA